MSSQFRVFYSSRGELSYSLKTPERLRAGLLKVFEGLRSCPGEQKSQSLKSCKRLTVGSLKVFGGLRLLHRAMLDLLSSLHKHTGNRTRKLCIEFNMHSIVQVYEQLSSTFKNVSTRIKDARSACLDFTFLRLYPSRDPSCCTRMLHIF